MFIKHAGDQGHCAWSVALEKFFYIDKAKSTSGGILHVINHNGDSVGMCSPVEIDENLCDFTNFRVIYE